MADQKSQPMVTVKKPDGTFVKVPLSELKKAASPAAAAPKPAAPAQPKPAAPRQTEPAAKAIPKAEPAAPVTQPQPAPKPQPQDGAQPAQTPPKSQIQIKQPPKSKPWTREDAKSPLEEKPLKSAPSAPAVSAGRESQVDEAIRRMGFTVAPDIQNRLRSVIQLRLKDLRTEEETLESAMRPSRDGGLDLSAEQAAKLVKICSEISLGAVVSEKKSLPAEEKEELPATATPFNAFVHGQPAAVAKPAVKEALQTGESEFKISRQPAVKQTMQDIAPPPAEMGPVEEIKYLSLTDFRRLSAKPEEAAKRLRQKLYNLQDESVLLYMEALAAYHRSPLFTDYMKLVCSSLANRKPLESLTQDKNRLQLAEIKALLEMEESL